MSDNTTTVENLTTDAAKAVADAGMAEYGEILGGLRSLGTEATEFSQGCIARNMAALRDLAEAQSVGQIVEIQSRLVTTTLEAMVTEGAKVRDAYSEAFARCMKPLQKMVSRPTWTLRHS